MERVTKKFLVPHLTSRSRRLFPILAVLLGMVAGWGGWTLTGIAARAEEGTPEATADTANGQKPEPKAKRGTRTRRAPKAVENPFPNRSPAPSLEGGVEWLNASGEITLKDLRGKVVLLDFWTYCCINCIHVLPDLKYLEEKYKKELVVIGVHSAKFDNEKDSENIRRAILRYEIEHPVINDANFTVWRKFHANSWPTFALIDPEGQWLGNASGEGQRKLLDFVIGKVVDYHRVKGTLDETPVRFDLEREKTDPTPLRFPGKLIADEASNRLFISDSNHNRIVISTLAGELLEVIGTGAIGAQDGDFATATFDHPQGMALDGDTLYVADTENHLIREIDLKARRVSTLAGTGEQSRIRGPGGPMKTTALNSPWALQKVGDDIYIAMAGPHQIWVLNLAKKNVRPYAGSGREDILNGPLNDAALAQPSGITTDGKFLYVVDSEGSAVRKVPLNPRGEVTTVVGPFDLPNGRSLFEFGDRDGVGSEVRLQHPLGIVYRDGTLFIADTYNHKIKRIDLAKGSAETYLGTGSPGDSDSPPQFSEPSGLSIAGDKLYIADTNNHRIRIADLKSGTVSTLQIQGLTPPPPPKASAAPLAGGTASKVAPQVVVAGDVLRLQVTLQYPEGYKLNTLAPTTWQVAAVGQQELVAAEALDKRQEVEVTDDVATLEIPLAQQTGKATLRLSLSYPYCREGVGGLCKLKTMSWLIPVEIKPEAAQKVISLKVDAD